jgi:hypothetical protein
MTLKPRDRADLERFAQEPLEWEVRILVLQAVAILRVPPNGHLGAGMPSHLHDAALEAWLVHLRLLDEFLKERQGGRNDPVRARHWRDDWDSDGCLDDELRVAINDQVVHIGWTRLRWTDTTRPPWEERLEELTDTCSDEMLRFFDAVADADADLGACFGRARLVIEWWRSREWRDEFTSGDRCYRQFETCIRRRELAHRL